MTKLNASVILVAVAKESLLHALFFKPAVLIVLATTFLITSAPITAADDTDIIVKARMNAMKDVAFSMKSLAQIMKGRDPFSTEKVKEILAVLEDKASVPRLYLKNMQLYQSHVIMTRLGFPNR
jgi:hypothetical protein